jgi:hypothetical protein
MLQMKSVLVLSTLAYGVFGFIERGFGNCATLEPWSFYRVSVDMCYDLPVEETCDQSVYAFPIEHGSWVTASTLDNVLVRADRTETVSVTLYDPFKARELTDDTREAVLVDMERRTNGWPEYRTTDHAYVLVETPRHGDAVLVVSLDNSERANKHDQPAGDRILEICKHVDKVYDEWDARSEGSERFVVTFLEGCRRSFHEVGYYRGKILHELPWVSESPHKVSMVWMIEHYCGLTWLDRDVRESADTSFCVATFKKPRLVRGFRKRFFSKEVVAPYLLPTSSTPAAAITFWNLVIAGGSARLDAETVWVAQLSPDNTSALRELAKLMKADRTSVCAVVDLNTTHVASMLDVVSQEGLEPLVDLKLPTYFGAYFDTVPELS